MNQFVDQLFLVLINGGIVLGVFVIILVNSKGGRKTRANMFLSILIAALTFSVFHLRYAGEVITHFSFKAYTLGDPTFLLIGPLLWFYVIELSGGRVKFSAATLVHFIPFFIIVFCSLSFRSFLKDTLITRLLDSHPRLPFTIFWMVMVVQFSAYQLLIHRKWREYQQLIRQEVSNTEDINISWVRFFTGVFLIINLSFFLSLFAVIHLHVINLVWKSVGVILSLSIFALGYKGILQKEILFPDIPVTLASAEPSAPRESEPKPDSALIEKLQQYMKNEKPFLDPELSLSTLAKAMGLNRNQLSQLINNGLGENFYDFINKYRVEEVKRLMVDPQKQNYNLLGMALEAGFKSKSTFNLIFKRFTGLTPTEYRKNIQS
ncbi:Helix-turn-helix domain-containing protein [Ohtaekwangia koreensis]|uniref:Helix-turn-helix domain-containing protein n=1 Tax=Ohtaekwangia koreensis TaxID=688867 RepID=A0A1T5M0X7_9BACT|nr:Helix-turn-helix domain-containing protein [Ohtaekwangia koreensis]